MSTMIRKGAYGFLRGVALAILGSILLNIFFGSIATGRLLEKYNVGFVVTAVLLISSTIIGIVEGIGKEKKYKLQEAIEYVFVLALIMVVAVLVSARAILVSPWLSIMPFLGALVTVVIFGIYQLSKEV